MVVPLARTSLRSIATRLLILTLRNVQGKRQKLRLLGRGTAADTWLFRDASLKTPVAVSDVTTSRQTTPSFESGRTLEKQWD